MESSDRETDVRAVPLGRVLGLARLARYAVAVSTGAAIGLGVYALTRIGGLTLYITTGALAGAAAALATQLYTRAAQLTEVRITVPQFSELTFVVNDESRRVAWRLYIEVVTRIAIQPLPDNSGLLREAMSSLHGLFATTRETLKDSRPSVTEAGPTVEHLAVTMLNRELRPFLALWHPKLASFEADHPDLPESEWPDNDACRIHLRGLQQRLRGYALGYARLAGVQDAARMIGVEIHG